eukprot:g7507.t1
MALADPDVGIGSLKIPLSIKRLQPTGRAYSIGIWSHFQLLDWTPHSTVFRSWMVNDAGESVLYFDSVHLQEVRDEHLQKVLQARSTLSVRAPIRLNMPFRGALTGLKPVPQTRQPVVLGSVQLRIRAVGLNFRDVLNARPAHR